MPPRPPNIRDVARAADVSVASVSRLLNATMKVSEERARRIRRAIKTLGYRPDPVARSFSLRRRTAVGLAVPLGERAYTSLVLSDVLAGITEAAAEAGWTIHVVPVRDGGAWPAALVDLVAGTIVMDVAAAAVPWADLKRTGHPAVLMNARRAGVPSVEIWNEEGGALAAERLAALGHRRIAVVGGRMEPMRLRAAGARAALRLRGIRTRIVEVDPAAPEPARRATRALLSGTAPPTAIFYASDWMAWAGLAEARHLGRRIPDDLSIIGFDDSVLAAETDPPLTTVRQPLSEMGRTAFRMLLAGIEGRRIESVRLPVSLVDRSTTAPPPR